MKAAGSPEAVLRELPCKSFRLGPARSGALPEQAAFWAVRGLQRPVAGSGGVPLTQTHAGLETLPPCPYSFL